MAFTNYEELQASVAEWLARTDLQSNIVDFIRLAEIRAQQELHLRFTQTELISTLTAGQDFLTWPDDLLEPIDLIILTDPRRHIEIVNKQSLEDVRQRITTDSPIAGYNRGLVIELAPTPKAADPYELIYWAGVPALTNTAPANVNWLLTNAPNLLLYGALLESAPFLGDDARLQTWEHMYDRAITFVRRQEFRARLGGGPLRVRPDVVA